LATLDSGLVHPHNDVAVLIPGVLSGINDCLIAAVAIRHSAQIVHRDSDFDVIAAMTGLIATSLK
jgi:predicted nucleic acid-binding protein